MAKVASRVLMPGLELEYLAYLLQLAVLVSTRDVSENYIKTLK
jgi:hypothetical protein